MSSFIGHGLTALVIGKVFAEKTNFKYQKVWQVFLILCAFAPDVDYVILSLNSIHNHGLRVTHSVVFSLLLPISGIFYLALWDRKNVFWGGLQACLAGLSHLVLDTLVGSRYADPLFYPFILETFKLPFGLLPSPGAIKFSNYYFYRNSLIEGGILFFAFLLILHLAKKLKLSRISWVFSLVGLLIFLSWSIILTR